MKELFNLLLTREEMLESSKQKLLKTFEKPVPKFYYLFLFIKSLKSQKTLNLFLRSLIEKKCMYIKQILKFNYGFTGINCKLSNDLDNIMYQRQFLQKILWRDLVAEQAPNRVSLKNDNSSKYRVMEELLYQK